MDTPRSSFIQLKNTVTPKEKIDSSIFSHCPNTIVDVMRNWVSWAFISSGPLHRLLARPPIQTTPHLSPQHPPVLPTAHVRRCRIGGNGGRRNGRGDGDNDKGDSGGAPHVVLGAASTMLLAKRRKKGGLVRGLRRQLTISHFIIAITVVMFLLQYVSGGWLLHSCVKANDMINAGQWWRFVTPVFLHGGIAHLAVNCYSLRAVGPVVESWYGHYRFIALYLFGGIMGNIVSYFGTPMPSLGASGAIFGLVGAMSVFILRHRRLLGESWKPSLQNTAWVIMMNFGMGLQPGAHIDNFGHLGGLVGGALFGFLAGPRLTPGWKNGILTYWDRPLYLVTLRRMRQFWKSLTKGNRLRGR